MTKNNALILVAHGSRREASNAEVRELSDKLNTLVAGQFDQTSCAFLELAEPSIPDAIDRAVSAGSQEVIILPYFLSAGRHVSEDIPAIVDAARQRHSDVTIHQAPYLGLAQQLTGVLADLAHNSSSRQD